MDIGCWTPIISTGRFEIAKLNPIKPQVELVLAAMNSDVYIDLAAAIVTHTCNAHDSLISMSRKLHQSNDHCK